MEVVGFVLWSPHVSGVLCSSLCREEARLWYTVVSGGGGWFCAVSGGGGWFALFRGWAVLEPSSLFPTRYSDAVSRVHRNHYKDEELQATVEYK